MSSHREAPEISKDPVADNADVYAFVSPDNPSMVTIISNFVPLQGPAGGPNFYEFGNDVLYSIYIDNDGDATPEIEYQFQFNTTVANQNTFLYNTGPITSLTGTGSSAWNRRQFYSVTQRIDKAGQVKSSTEAARWATGTTAAASRASRASGTGRARVPARSDPRDGARYEGFACPPCNIGPRSTPMYETNLGSAAVQSLGTGEGQVFCGQRSDPFFVDLGSIFDLADLRPFQNLHCRSPRRIAAANGGMEMERHEDAQHPRDRPPGADLPDLTSDGSTPTDRVEPRGRARHLERSQPPQGADDRRPDEPGRRLRSVGAGLAARQSFDQRGDHPDEQEGRVGNGAATRSGDVGPVPRTMSSIRSSAGLLPVLYRQSVPEPRRR